MDIRRVGIILVIISVGIGGGVVALSFFSGYDSCLTHSDPFTLLSHGLLEFLISILSLGGYLLYLGEGKDELLNKVQEDSRMRNEDFLWSVLMKGLTEDERRVLSSVKEQDGISQHTLGLRVDMHKSKLSIVLTELAKKNLIIKLRKGKINHVHLKVSFPTCNEKFSNDAQ